MIIKRIAVHNITFGKSECTLYYTDRKTLLALWCICDNISALIQSQKGKLAVINVLLPYGGGSTGIGDYRIFERLEFIIKLEDGQQRIYVLTYNVNIYYIFVVSNFMFDKIRKDIYFIIQSGK